MVWLGCLRIAAALALALAAPVHAHPDLDEVRAALEKEAEQNPGDPSYALRHSALHLEADDYDAALDAIAVAEAHGATTTDVETARGRTYLEAGWLKTAQRHLELALAEDPHDDDARLLRGRTLVRLGRPGEGAKDFEIALRAAEQPQPHNYLEHRDALIAALDEEGALAALSAGVTRLGPVVSLQMPAIDLELGLGRPADALVRIDTLLAQQPRNELWLAKRGEILVHAGRPAEAKDTYETALGLLRGRPSRRRTPRTRTLEADIQTALAPLARPTEER